MNKLLKMLIVWLMLAAIPFQGLAAASMLACAPAQAAHAAMAPEHCATMVMTHDVAATDAAVHVPAHHHADGKCSTCATCCCAAAMAPPALFTRAPGVTAAPAAFHADDSAIAPVDLALPERPPKPFARLA